MVAAGTGDVVTRAVPVHLEELPRALGVDELMHRLLLLATDPLDQLNTLVGDLIARNRLEGLRGHLQSAYQLLLAKELDV